MESARLELDSFCDTLKPSLKYLHVLKLGFVTTKAKLLWIDCSVLLHFSWLIFKIAN